MTACGGVWLVQGGCLPEDAPLAVDIQDPVEYLQQPPEGMYMPGADVLRLRENHQHSFEEDLAAAAAADPSALHP